MKKHKSKQRTNNIVISDEYWHIYYIFVLWFPTNIEFKRIYNSFNYYDNYIGDFNRWFKRMIKFKK